MLSICNICLNVGHSESLERELPSLEGPLRKFYDELCGTGTHLEDAIYCPKCVYLLRKFYNFRNKCRKANDLLKKWKNEPQDTRIQLNKLYTKLSPTSLGLSNDANRTVYYISDECYTENNNCNAFNITGEGVFLESTSIIEKSFNQIFEDDGIFTKIECENETFTETNNDSHYVDFEMLDNDTELNEIKAELDDDHFLVVLANNAEESKEGQEIDDDDQTDCGDDLLNSEDINDADLNDGGDDINDADLDIYNKTLNRKEIKASGKKERGPHISRLLEKVFNTDLTNDEILQIKHAVFSSRQELLTAIKEYEKNFSEEPNKFMTKLEIDFEKTKEDLKRKLENGDVKDKDGNTIEMDVILNNLDKLTKASYTRIKKYCTGDEHLSPQGIFWLSQMQKRYGNRYSSIFITKHLTTHEEILEAFKQREMNPSYLQSEYKCTKCFRYFKSARWLDYHNSEFHDPNKPFTCQLCECTLKNRSNANHHLRKHRVEYQCKLCPLVTNYERVRDIHFNIHMGVKYPCTKCDAVLTSPQSLSAHFNRLHHVVNFMCPCCALTFHSQLGLSLHKKQKHPDDLDTVGPSSATCEECNINFISDEVYQVHLMKSHDDKSNENIKRKRRNEAEHAERKKIQNKLANRKEETGRSEVTKKRKQNKLANRKEETGRSEVTKKRKPLFRSTPKYTCRVCKSVETSMGALILHFQSEHPWEEQDRKLMAVRAPYRHLCHECGKGFKLITAFKAHQNMHNGVRPYACTDCPKTFYGKKTRDEHMKIHRAPTYQCPICDKKFHSIANLSNHKRIHTGNRRYACEVCGKTFLHQCAVTAHIRGVHLQIRRKRNTRNSH